MLVLISGLRSVFINELLLQTFKNKKVEKFLKNLFYSFFFAMNTLKTLCFLVRELEMKLKEEPKVVCPTLHLETRIYLTVTLLTVISLARLTS